MTAACSGNFAASLRTLSRQTFVYERTLPARLYSTYDFIGLSIRRRGRPSSKSASTTIGSDPYVRYQSQPVGMCFFSRESMMYEYATFVRFATRFFARSLETTPGEQLIDGSGARFSASCRAAVSIALAVIGRGHASGMLPGAMLSIF